MAKTKDQTPAKETVEKKAPAAPKYHLEVSVNDVEYKGTGNSIADALTNFIESGDFPYGTKTRVFMKYGKGKAESKRFMQPTEARRVFNMISTKPSALELFAAKLEAELA